MNIDYLKCIEDTNIELLTPAMSNEFNKIRFKFNIKNDGTYYIKTVFNNLYIDTPSGVNNDELNKRIQFNQDLKTTITEYDNGFMDGFYEKDILKGVQEKENQIYQVFSGIYRKFERIKTPSFLHFKNNISSYNGIDFLKVQLYNYGYEVGCYIRSWTIILNNINLFEEIFNSKYSGDKKKKSDYENVWFKVGLLFARKEIYRKTVQVGGVALYNYYHLEEEFKNPNQLSKHLGLSRQYIEETFQNLGAPHDIYSNHKQMSCIVKYCNEKGYKIDEDFLCKYDLLNQKQS